MSDDQSPLTIPTPGAYLRARRWVAGLSIDEVAARIRTDPRLGELDRIQWLKSIEADVVPPSFSTIVALNMVFSFDLNALALLDAIARGQLSSCDAPALARSAASNRAKLSGRLAIAARSASQFQLPANRSEQRRE